MKDPVNSYLAYLFTKNKNIGSGTFGVFKMDFSLNTPNYDYIILSINSGS